MGAAYKRINSPLLGSSMDTREPNPLRNSGAPLKKATLDELWEDTSCLDTKEFTILGNSFDCEFLTIFKHK
jgi:hypothetical protein